MYIVSTTLKSIENLGAERLAKRLRHMLRVIKWQRNLPLTTPVQSRLKIAHTGFRPSSYALYELDIHDPSDYLPDTHYFDSTHINGDLATRLLGDKFQFSSFLGHYLPVPRVLTLLDSGQVHPIAPEAPVQDFETLLEQIEACGGVFFKPNMGRKGQGVFEVRVSGASILLDNRPINRNELEQKLVQLDDYLVTARVEQAEYAAQIFPNSVNSVRLITMQDAEHGLSPFIAVATHRFGGLGSGPTDNVSRGGLHAEVDLVTGELGSAMHPPEGAFEPLIWHERHPETGTPIRGVRIPHWEAIKEQLLETVQRFPFLKHVGWDVVVSNEGFWVLEGNANPASAPQMFHPYLKDPRVKQFYMNCGVL